MSTTAVSAVPSASVDADPTRLLRPEVPVWTWERPLTPDVAAAARALADGPCFELRVRAALDEVRGAIEATLAGVGCAPDAARRALAADVARLSVLLAGISALAGAACEEVEVRVEHDPAAMCPVFHQDHNVVRLLCTYAGPGTEWLPERDVDRRELGLRGRTPAEANRAIARAAPVRSVPGEVLVGKGARFAEGHPAFVHRSPAASLGPRLLVAVDPVGV